MTADQSERLTRREVGAPETPPPVLGTWRTLYAVVLGELAGLILLFYALTRWAS